jgi:hypothetical protein
MKFCFLGKLKIKTVTAGLLICFVCFTPVFADAVDKTYKEKMTTGDKLLTDSEYYDGKTVIFTGEVIGDIMEDGNHRWINVKNDSVVIGVFLDKNQAEKIKYLGRYNIRGDILKIRGIYNANCSQHYGDRDIHAEEIDIISRGEYYYTDIENRKIFLSFILAFTTLFFIFYSRRVDRRDNA